MPLYEHVQMSGWDTMVCLGQNLKTDEARKLAEIVSDYSTVYVYGYSLGVAAAIRALKTVDIHPAALFAVNGTPTPCDDMRGIPVAIYEGTTEGLTERNLKKFQMRMFGDTSLYREWADRLPRTQSVDRLQKELREATAEIRAVPTFDAAFIGTADRIFPPENQHNAWDGLTKVVEIEAPHFIDLQNVIERTIVDTGRVAARFNRAMHTYSAHAHAQRLIAERLMELAFQRRCEVQNLIEVGPGTGLFTALWQHRWNVQKALYMDLCDMPHYGAAPREQYLQGDAEESMQHVADEKIDRVDAVVSASAIQWLSNLPLFFHNCAAVMHDGALLAVSTFAPGNLKELLALRPDLLRYPSADELAEMARREFRDVAVSCEDVEIEFTTPLEALRHLSLTGVTTAGTRTSVGELRRFAAAYPMNARGRYTLTFRPLYLIANK